MRIAMMTNNYKPVVGGVPIAIERLAEGLREVDMKYTYLRRSLRVMNRKSRL